MDLRTLEIGMSEVSGLIAVVAAFLIWRMSGFPSLISEISSLRYQARLGFLRASALLRYWFLRFEFIFQIVGVILFCSVLILASDFYNLVHRLLDSSRGLDLSVVKILIIHADELHSIISSLVFLILVLLVVGWLLRLTTEGYGTDAGSHPYGHPFYIPPGWNQAGAALWEARAETALDCLRETRNVKDTEGLKRIVEDGSWRLDWASWAMAINAYRHLVAIECRRWTAKRENSTQ